MNIVEAIKTIFAKMGLKFREAIMKVMEALVKIGLKKEV